MEWPTVFDGLAGSLTSPEKPVENVPLHKRPPQLLQGARTSAYMRTCSELEPPCSFWLQLSEYDWMRGTPPPKTRAPNGTLFLEAVESVPILKGPKTGSEIRTRF